MALKFLDTDMVGTDFEYDEGGWVVEKDGQSVPVSLGIPTVRVSEMTVGGKRMNDLLDQARQIAEKAQALGAPRSQGCCFPFSEGVDVEWRDGQLERLSDTTDQSLSVSLYVDGRFPTIAPVTFVQSQ